MRPRPLTAAAANWNEADELAVAKAAVNADESGLPSLHAMTRLETWTVAPLASVVVYAPMERRWGSCVMEIVPSAFDDWRFVNAMACGQQRSSSVSAA